MRRIRVVILTLALAVVFLAVSAASASAYPGLTSWSEKQTDPGLTLRTIYGSCQVFMYELPGNVTHKGYIHAELSYKPGDWDYYVYLIDAAGNICSWTETQGYAGTWGSKEIVDFLVPSITDKTPVLDEDGNQTDIVGDKYFIMVQAFDDVSHFQISGYYPKMDLAYGSSTTSEGNWYRETFRYPKSKDDWKKMFGAPYGSPFDFTPTSVGSAWMQLRYPWDVTTKLPMDEYTDPALKLANFDQYMYPSDWGETGAIWDYDWAGSSHWNETSIHGSLPPVETGDPAWTRGNSYQFLIESGAPKAPHKMLHYIPVLWMVSSDAALGKAAPPKTGMSTVGYRASLVYPQNLRLRSLPYSVNKGSKITLKGTLAISPSWAELVGPDAIAWAPVGTEVTVERKTADSYKPIGTAVVGEGGAWSFKVTANVTARYRVTWKGSAMKAISVNARKDADDGSGGRVWQDWFVTDLAYPSQAIFNDGSVDLAVEALSATDGVALHTTWDTAVDTATGAPWTSQTLNAGDSLAITMSDGTNVEVNYKSLKYFVERSVAMRVRVP